MAASKEVFLREKNKKEAKKTFFNLYIAWLALAFFLGRVGGYLNTGKKSDLLALLAEVIFFIYLLLVWRFKNFIIYLLDLLKIKGAVRFVLLGLSVSLLGEGFYYFVAKSSIGLIAFLLRPLFWYIGWYLIWWRLMTKYRYSLKELFLLAGLNGYIVEGIFLHQLPLLSPIGIFLYPLIASAYGVMMLVPAIISDPEINLISKNLKVSLKKKYSLGILPLIAFFIPGLIWFNLIQLIFNIK